LTEGRGSVTPCLHGLFDRLHPPHALAARCGIVVRRRILFPGRPFARPRSRAEMPGFFALAAETPILRAAWTRARRIQRSRTPCADRLGERTKRQRLGHVNVAPRRRPTASWLPHGRREARAPNPASGFSAHEMRDPTRLPRSRFEGSITRPTEPKDHHDRGACWGLSTFARPEHPSAPRTTIDPVAGQKPSPSLDSAPRGALRPFLGHSVKMPRNRFYNRRSRHEHSQQTPPSETARRPPWETRRRSTSGPFSGRGVSAKRSENGAGPPCGHPASNGFALDGATPASGRSTATLAHARVGGERRRFIGCRRSVDSNPVTPLVGARIKGRRSDLVPDT